MIAFATGAGLGYAPTFGIGHRQRQEAKGPPHPAMGGLFVFDSVDTICDRRLLSGATAVARFIATILGRTGQGADIGVAGDGSSTLISDLDTL